tara:strand:+ start:266 stop:739 length:474 start_codon:yes stop_codon:yes gene_type:complete
MADYDAKSCSKTMPITLDAALAADNTPVAIDTAGYRSVIIQSNVGIGGITFSASNKIEFVLSHGSTSTYGSSTVVAAEDVVMPYGEAWATGGIIRSLIAAHAAVDAEVHTVGYIGKERYLFLLMDFTGTHGVGTPIATQAVLGDADINPIWQASIEV